jgi:peptidyl-prolyl cis-trans isomerase SurA
LADTTITLAEFESAYRNTNNSATPADDSLPAYKDFLGQYVNYRLKVRAARDAGLDTLASVQKEVRSYRNEMARPRLMRSEVYKPLTRTLYERQKTEVDVSHILARVSPDAAPEDTLTAYRKMQSIADSLEDGVPFSDLAYRNSEDPSAQKKGQRGFRGRIGYLTAGQIVKPFEDRMYSVPPDSTSNIFRTRFGYHILKVHDRRPAQPSIRLSHIMTRPSGDSAAARHLLDSLRTEIVQNGAPFDSLARQYSEDRRSAAKGGDLGTVNSRQSLPPAFRTAVTSLDSVGAVSPVVQSQYGYHLIKLTDREEPKSYEDSYEELKKQIADRPRVERRKEAVSKSIRAEEGTRVDTARILRTAPVASLDSLSRPLLSFVDGDSSKAASPIATLGDSSYTLGQLARHVMQTDGGARLSVGDVLDDFLDEKAFQYAQARLEQTDPSFAATMKEYREGLLVFQFMQDSVWSVAARDTAALRQFHREHRNQYRFPDRVRTIVVRAPTDSLVASYDTTGTADLSALVQQATADSLVHVDTTMITDDSPEVYQRVLSMADRSITGPIRHEGETLLLARDTVRPARTKTFKEALSGVIRDYQDQYEDQVLSRLRERYEVDTYPERLRQAFSTSDSSRMTSTN